MVVVVDAIDEAEVLAVERRRPLAITHREGNVVQRHRVVNLQGRVPLGGFHGGSNAGSAP